MLNIPQLFFSWGIFLYLCITKQKAMIYKFNSHSLEFERVNLNKMLIILTLIIFSFGFGTSTVTTKLIEGEKRIIIKSENEFSKENLIQEIKKFNFKYPDIIYAQAIVESGNFKSNVFLENNNLFGMREAGSRATTATETKNNHALYKNWKDSLIDRALYESAYLRNLSKNEYLQFLRKNYSETAEYDKAILTTIKNNNIKF